jgi:hypothetical protein
MYTKYKLTDDELIQITRLCVQEQGTSGSGYEASLMCNLYEKYGSKYSSLYSYVRNSGWFYKAAYYMEHGTYSVGALEKVKSVICDGKRLLPTYVDEHDALTDIISVSNDGVVFDKHDKDKYIRDVTKVKQNPDKFKGGGITWTFYCFPTKTSDPFGYTSKPSEAVQNTTGMCVGDDVNIRKGPATSYSSIGHLNKGDVVIITGSVDSWYKCTIGNLTGFIYRKYIISLDDTVDNIYNNLLQTYSVNELRTLLPHVCEKLDA